MGKENVMFERLGLARFADTARAAVEDASYEAGRRGDGRIGTEHLLLAVVQDETVARAVGVDRAAVLAAADELDRAALTAVGIDTGHFPVNGHTTLGKQLPFTPGAKTVLQQTLVHATNEKAKNITCRHMALALLDRVDPDPAAAILTALSVDRGAARDRLNGSV